MPLKITKSLFVTQEQNQFIITKLIPKQIILILLNLTFDISKIKQEIKSMMGVHTL